MWLGNYYSAPGRLVDYSTRSGILDVSQAHVLPGVSGGILQRNLLPSCCDGERLTIQDVGSTKHSVEAHYQCLCNAHEGTIANRAVRGCAQPRHNLDVLRMQASLVQLVLRRMPDG